MKHTFHFQSSYFARFEAFYTIKQSVFENTCMFLDATTANTAQLSYAYFSQKPSGLTMALESTRLVTELGTSGTS
jgi:hypothetical protein